MQTGTRMNLKKILTSASLVAALLLVSCGKKAPPRPPEALAPSPVKFLTASATVDGVTLFWQSPSTTASGDPLEDLHGFVIERSEHEKGEEPDFDTLVELALPETSEPSKEGTEASKRFSYKDTSVKAGKSYEYSVVGVNEDGVEGAALSTIRVTFIGESSVIETSAASALN